MTTKLINIDPQIVSGTPVFAGTRVPVEILFEFLNSGDTIDEFLDGFPSVTREQVLGVLQEAERLVIQGASRVETAAR